MVELPDGLLQQELSRSFPLLQEVSLHHKWVLEFQINSLTKRQFSVLESAALGARSEKEKGATK